MWQKEYEKSKPHVKSVKKDVTQDEEPQILGLGHGILSGYDNVHWFKA